MKYEDEKKKILDHMSLPENQGGDLTKKELSIYVLLGVVFPIVLLFWGWN